MKNNNKEVEKSYKGLRNNIKNKIKKMYLQTNLIIIKKLRLLNYLKIKWKISLYLRILVNYIKKFKN